MEQNTKCTRVHSQSKYIHTLVLYMLFISSEYKSRNLNLPTYIFFPLFWVKYYRYDRKQLTSVML